MCRACDLPFSNELHERYRAHNSAVWTMFDRGEATKEFIVLERFRRFFADIGVERDVELANRVHLDTLATCSFPTPHSVEVVKTLSRTHHIFLITNAVARVQRGRLARAEIRPYIEAAFISDEAGAQKPTRAFFDYVFSRIDGIRRDNALVIGDSLTSDMRGAVDYGLKSCWYNPEHAENTEQIAVDFEIDDLRQLYDIV